MRITFNKALFWGLQPTFAAKRSAGSSTATPYHPLSVLNVAIPFHFSNSPGIAFRWCWRLAFCYQSNLINLFNLSTALSCCGESGFMWAIKWVLRGRHVQDNCQKINFKEQILNINIIKNKEGCRRLLSLF